MYINIKMIKKNVQSLLTLTSLSSPRTLAPHPLINKNKIKTFNLIKINANFNLPSPPQDFGPPSSHSGDCSLKSNSVDIMLFSLIGDDDDHNDGDDDNDDETFTLCFSLSYVS